VKADDGEGNLEMIELISRGGVVIKVRLKEKLTV
jgi:hypothetical protein